MLPLRRDAERNRQRILDVAGEVFAEQGLSASMNDIAAAAGLGVGTVYRRFPERMDLVRALFEQRILRVEELARACLEDPDPWQGLASFIEQTLAWEVDDRSLCQLLDDEELRHSLVGRSDGIRSAVRTLVRRGQEAGVLRSDIGIGDLLVLRRMVTEAAWSTHAVRPDYWRRMLALFLDGLRAPGATRLPGTALGPAELRATVSTALSRARRG